MKHEKLSEIQQRALLKLIEKSKEWMSSYDLQEELNTMKSLCRKDVIEYKDKKLIVKSKSGLGTYFFPQTTITFKVFLKKTN